MVTPPNHPPSLVYKQSETLGSSYEDDLTQRKANEYLQDLGRLVTSTPDLKRLCEGLESGVGSQVVISNVGLEVVALLLRKNSDYGDTAGRSPLLAPDLSAGEAILVRMSDKIARLSNLLQADKNTAQVAESVGDTMRDLAGYAILWLVANHKDKPNALA